MTHIDLSPPPHARGAAAPGANLRWAMLLVIFLTRTSMGFQFQSIAALTSFLVPAFALSYAEVGLLMGLFMLPGVVIAVPGGLLGQRFGSLRVVVVGLGLMIVRQIISAHGGTITYNDLIPDNNSYVYRVRAINVVGDTWNYADPGINQIVSGGFPTVTTASMRRLVWLRLRLALTMTS